MGLFVFACVISWHSRNKKKLASTKRKNIVGRRKGMKKRGRENERLNAARIKG